MYDQIIKLIKETKIPNEYGDLISEETERTVFVELRSIGQAEFYQAQAVGLKPEIKFILSDFLEYQGEKKLKYAPFNSEEAEYNVIRTYRSDNRIELICRRGVDE